MRAVGIQQSGRPVSSFTPAPVGASEAVGLALLARMQGAGSEHGTGCGENVPQEVPEPPCFKGRHCERTRHQAYCSHRPLGG